jgi:hypothetical protein
LNRIFASVYDGDPVLLQGLVENEAANEYVRNAAIYSFVVLERSGQMPRDHVVDYFRSLFREKLGRTFSYAWTGLARAVADLPAPELLEDLRRAYKEDLLEISRDDLEHIERELRRHERRFWEKAAVITDAIAEMEWWASFRKAGKASSKPARAGHAAGEAPPQSCRTRRPPRLSANDSRKGDRASTLSA